MASFENVMKLIGKKDMSKQEIFDRINNDFEGITDKTGPWNYLKRYYEVKI